MRLLRFRSNRRMWLLPIILLRLEQISLFVSQGRKIVEAVRHIEADPAPTSRISN